MYSEWKALFKTSIINGNFLVVGYPDCIWTDETTETKPIFRKPDTDPNYKTQSGCFALKSQMTNYLWSQNCTRTLITEAI